MTDLLQRIESSTRDRRLLKHGEKILIAVSGGLDSMVLLHALEKISAQTKWKIVVAHFNHRLRGRASDEDEKLVRATAMKRRLPVFVGSADVKAFAGRSKLSVEMAARKLRHEFLVRTAREQKIRTIALAHHADDQVELFFLRLLRGSGGEGLGGMKWTSPSPADKAVGLVRPLLDSVKADLQAFADENRVKYRDDASNFSPDFLRNRIRNELLPLLRRNYQPALAKTVLRLMEIVGAESDFVGEAARLGGVTFEQLPTSVQRRVLQARLVESGIAADFDLIESLRQSPGQFVCISSKLSVARDNQGKIKLREDSWQQFGTGEWRVKLAGKAGWANVGGKKIKWRISAADKKRKRFASSSAGPKQEFFDADRIGDEIVFRHWRAGDRFQPIGLKRPAKLQDLFVNAKIPRQQRHRLLLAAGASGEIFWVEGLRISENFKLTQKTRHYLIWDWR